jgi:predicted DNA-binding ribbon-helix-helix protein
MRSTDMKSSVVKRSIVVGGHKTSVSLEDDFWVALKEIAAERNKQLSEVVSEIDTGRENANLSSAIRLFVLSHYRDDVSTPRTGVVAGHNGAASGELAHT